MKKAVAISLAAYNAFVIAPNRKRVSRNDKRGEMHRNVQGGLDGQRAMCRFIHVRRDADEGNVHISTFHKRPANMCRNDMH